MDGATKMSDERLISDFGCGALDQALLDRWERVTGVRPHVFMRRGLFFAHRELHQVLDAKERGDPIYIYTGRGPSSDALHLGHLIPFLLTKYLQDALGCALVIQITDDEKFMRKSHLTFDKISEYTEANIRDILALGFDPEKTFILRQSKCADLNVPFLAAMSAQMSLHVVNNLFGFSSGHNVGYVVFPAKQIAPAFGPYFRGLLAKPRDTVCLIPCGREQDPYFRAAREVAKKLKIRRPSTIYGRLIPGLDGKAKMSASVPDSAIYLTDSPDDVRAKVMKAGDVVMQLLTALDDDDEFVQRLRHDSLENGEAPMTLQVAKERLIRVVNTILEQQRARRANVTGDLVARSERIRILN
jgi:tryptophanyl-tRNA synthetase